MEPGGSMSHSQGPSIIHILSRINLIPRFDIYFYKIHFNIVLPSMPRLSYLIPFWLHALSLLDLIALTLLGERYKQ